MAVFLNLKVKHESCFLGGLCSGCNTVPGTEKSLTSCSQVQERVLLWNSVLRCSCNSSELYSPLFFISPTVHILLVWNFPVSRSTQFPEARVFFLLAKSVGPSLLLGAHTQFSLLMAFFFLLSGCNQDNPSPSNVFAHQPGEWPLLNSLSSQKLPSCNRCGLQWPNEHELEHADKRILSVQSLPYLTCSSSECPTTCTYSSLPLGWTQPVLEMWDSPCLCWK